MFTFEASRGTEANVVFVAPAASSGEIVI